MRLLPSSRTPTQEVYPKYEILYFRKICYKSLLQSLPPNLPLKYVDSGLTITASDLDFIAQTPSNEDTSCNKIECEIVSGTDLRTIVQCEVELLSSGEYDVLLSLTQKIDSLEEDSYNFQIVAKVIFNIKFISSDS